MKDRQRAVRRSKFEVLSKDDQEKIYSAALEVLEKTGMRLHEPEALSLLKAAGATVEKDMVRFPVRLVERALETAPKEVLLYTRDGQPALLLNTQNSYFGNGSDCVYILDSFTGDRRRFTKEDVGNAARVVDALENLDFVMPAGIVSDKPVSVADVHAFQVTTFNTVKPVCYTAMTRQETADIIDVASIIAGGEDELRKKPFLIQYIETSSPLSYSTGAAEMLLLCAERGVPIICSPGPIAGASAPATLAGILVLHLAESLSMLVISQLKNEGTPAVIGGCASVMDMKTTVSAYGGPEFWLLNAALTELCHSLGLPMFGTAGCSDAKKVDGQVAIESALSAATQSLCGADLIHDVGYIDSGLTQSFDSLVIADEILGMVDRIRTGIEVDDERLAVDLIDKVGAGGNYMAQPHTVKYFRSEFWMPELLTRENYESWIEGGSKTLEERANEKTKSILNDHKAPPLGEEIKEEIFHFLESREAKI